MLVGWILYCSFLFLSCFPTSAPSPGGVPQMQEPPTFELDQNSIVEMKTDTRSSGKLSVLPGVLLEDIPKGSAIEKAGLKPGDVILRWERSTNLPLSAEDSGGTVESPFDWMWLEVEQAPKGALRLVGERAGKTITFMVNPGLWRLKPHLTLVSDRNGERLSSSVVLEQNQSLQRGSTWCKGGSSPLAELKGLAGLWMLVEEGQRLAKANRSLDAEACYLEALASERKPKVALYALLLLGRLYERSGALTKAESTSQQAVLVAEATTNAELHLAQALLEVEDLVFARGDLVKARELAVRAHVIHKRLASNSLALASSDSSLGLVEWKAGNLKLAANYFTQALSVRTALAAGTIFQVESLNDLASVHRELGDQDRAISLFERALSILHELPSVDHLRVVILGNLGNIALDRGDLRLAEDHYKQILLTGRKDAAGQERIRAALSNLGGVSSLRGDLEVAERFYEQALALTRNSVPNSLEEARVLTNLGIVAQNRGELEAAFGYQEEALEIKKRLAPDSLVVAGTLQNLGAIRREQRQLEDSSTYYTAAWNIRKEKAAGSLDLALSLKSIGYVARDLGNLKAARKYFESALLIERRQAPEGLATAATLSALGELAVREGNLRAAARYHEAALAIRRSVAPRSIEEATSQFFLARIHLGLGERRRSVELMRTALLSLEEQASRIGDSADSRGSFNASVAEIYRFGINLAVHAKEFGWAFSSLEQFRARGFLAHMAQRDLDLTRDIPPELEARRAKITANLDRNAIHSGVPELLSKVSEGEDGFARQRRLERERSDVARAIRRTSPRLASLQYPQPLDSTGARNVLDVGTIMLSYMVGEEEVVLFTLSHDDDLRVHILPIGERELRQWVTRVRGLIAEARGGTELGELRAAELRRASKKLFALLLGPAAEEIARAGRVIIVPDGPLHTLPFGLLIREARSKDGRLHDQYLSEWRPIHLALSGTVYAELKRARREAGFKTKSQLFLTAFGDPQYPPIVKDLLLGEATEVRVRSAVRRGGLRLDSLPYSRVEVEGVASLFPPAEKAVYLGPEATEENAKAVGSGSRIVHFATHANLDERFPLNSALVLTMPEGFPEGRENGLFQAWEIFESVRLDADLVVLSACETALGEEQSGEGLIGLTRAFQYAGARTVMASLWSVQDQATSELMIRFYKHLRAGLSKDEALRQAQIELIRGPIEVVNEKGEKTVLNASAPYFWAGFQLYGDWQ